LPSWRHEESHVETSEHQDNTNVHHQPFPESVSEEHEIHTDYNGSHRHHVKHYSYSSVHFSTTLLPEEESDRIELSRWTHGARSEGYDSVNVKPSSIQPVTPPINIFTGKPTGGAYDR
jgi:hypothetical protein